MADDVDTRVSLDLDPGTLEALPHFHEEDARAVISPTEGVMRSAWSALRAIHDAKAAVSTDPTLNEYAQLLATDDYANQRMAPVTKQWDRTFKDLEANIARFEQEMDAPVVSKASQMVSGEIRAHFKSLPVGERMAGIQQAIREGDETVATAVLGAPGMLSGFDEEMKQILKREWAARTMPVTFKRHTAARACYDLLNQRGGLLLREWRKAVGDIKVYRETADGKRQVLVQTITPEDVRRQKNSAAKAFVLPDAN